jgi:hypothetical protein
MQTDLRYLNPLIEYAKGYEDKSVEHFIFGHIHIPHQCEKITFLGNWADGCSWAELDSNGSIELKTTKL